MSVRDQRYYPEPMTATTWSSNLYPRCECHDCAQARAMERLQDQLMQHSVSRPASPVVPQADHE